MLKQVKTFQGKAQTKIREFETLDVNQKSSVSRVLLKYDITQAMRVTSSHALRLNHLRVKIEIQYLLVRG